MSRGLGPAMMGGEGVRWQQCVTSERWWHCYCLMRCEADSSFASECRVPGRARLLQPAQVRLSCVDSDCHSAREQNSTALHCTHPHPTPRSPNVPIPHPFDSTDGPTTPHGRGARLVLTCARAIAFRLSDHSVSVVCRIRIFQSRRSASTQQPPPQSTAHRASHSARYHVPLQSHRFSPSGSAQWRRCVAGLAESRQRSRALCAHSAGTGLKESLPGRSPSAPPSLPPTLAVPLAHPHACSCACGRLLPARG